MKIIPKIIPLLLLALAGCHPGEDRTRESIVHVFFEDEADGCRVYRVWEGTNVWVINNRGGLWKEESR